MSLKNAGLVVFRDGILEVQIDSSVGDYGRRETGMVFGGCDGPASLYAAEATLTPLSRPEESVVVEVEPDSPALVPYLGFDIGDWLLLPGVEGFVGSLRTQAISGRVDDEGSYTSLTPEFGTARDVLAQRYSRWLNRTNGGTVDGRSRLATPASPSIIDVTIVAPYTDTISTPGDYTATGDEVSAYKAMDTARRLVKIEGRANDAGTGPTTLKVIQNGVDTTTTATIAADETSVTTYITGGPTWDVADTYGGRISVAGGHQGISWVLTWVDMGG